MNYGFVIDNRSCIGCHACSTACKSENSVPLGVNRTWVKYTEVGQYPDVQRHFQVNRCNHCANPPCVRICPVTAMYQRDDGIVEFNGDACIGCKACLQACPYDAIHIDPDTGTAAKCHYCGHRVSQGMEPACVVVCPTHSIIAGDMDDPTSEIAIVMAGNELTVRKPEQNTEPNLFYIEGHPANLDPLATERQPAGMMWSEVLPIHPGPIIIEPVRKAEQMVQVAYNAQHTVPWHWQVPAYLLTKSVGTGLWLLLSLGLFIPLGIDPGQQLSVGLVGLLMTGLTTVLLILDLERPERFLSILTRPQWRSWLTRGAFLLIGFSTITGIWWLKHWAVGPNSLDIGFAALTLPLAIGTAIYTAFLFGQAEGRDLWQSKLLAPHLFVQSVVAGSGTFLLLDLVVGGLSLNTTMANIFGVALVIDLCLGILDIVVLPHSTSTAKAAAKSIIYGRYKVYFWLGGVVIGHLLPLLLLWGGGMYTAIAALAALAGLYLYEHAFVYAPQDIPNS